MVSFQNSEIPPSKRTALGKSGPERVKKGCRPQKQHKFWRRTTRCRFLLLIYPKYCWPLRGAFFAFCVVRLLPYPQTKRFGHRRFFGKTARRSALLPSARHASSMPRSGAAPLIHAVCRKSSIGNEKIFSFGKSKNAAIRAYGKG